MSLSLTSCISSPSFLGTFKGNEQQMFLVFTNRFNLYVFFLLFFFPLNLESKRPVRFSKAGKTDERYFTLWIWASHLKLSDVRRSKHAPLLRASPLKHPVNLITLSIIPWYVKKSPLIKATSFKSKEHVELRQPSICPLSIKERTHTPLSIYLAKCSINIKLISPLRVSITQTFFS